MTFPKSNVVQDLDARESVLDSLQITIYDFFLLRILPRLYSVCIIYIYVYVMKKKNIIERLLLPCHFNEISTKLFDDNRNANYLYNKTYV